MEMSSILLATGNPHKLEKLTWIIGGFFDPVESLRDHPIDLELEESATTFEGNAVLKATAFSKEYGGYAIATDGGVSIPALGDQWDAIRTKRFAGEGATDEERIAQLLKLMKNKKGDERAMNWREAIAIAKDGELLFSTEVDGVHGVLEESFDPTKYKPGIWVCSVWYFPEIGKNFFDMTEKEQEYVEQSWHELYQQTREYLTEHRPA